MHIWASVYAFGSHLALVRADARHDAQVRTRPALAGVHTLYSLYIASTCTKHRYERLAEALQLYSALQRSTSLQLYILYSIHPSTAPLSLHASRRKSSLRGWPFQKKSRVH